MGSTFYKIFNWLPEKNIKYDMNIYLCGSSLTKEIAQKIFPKAINEDTLTLNFNSLENKDFYKSLKPKDKINWKAKLYLGKINEEIAEKIHKEINSPIIVEEIEKCENELVLNTNEKNESFSAVIVCFDDDNFPSLLNKFNENNQFNMPFFILLSKTKKEFNFTDNRYISNIIYKDLNDVKTIEYIISILYFKDCYFNERGGDTWNFVPANIFGEINKRSNRSLNILVTGAARVGKSTLINLLSNKLVSLEADDQTSVTNKIKKYMIPLGENEDYNGHLKIIDTPGIIDLKHQDQIIKIIEDLVKTEKIDIILFLMNPTSPLDNCMQILSFINNLKIKTYFIYNRCDRPKDFEPLKKTLKNFENLYSQDDSNYLFMRLKEVKIKKEVEEDEEEENNNNYEIKPIYGVKNLIKKLIEYSNKKYIVEEDNKKIDSIYKKYINYRNLLFKKYFYFDDNYEESIDEEINERLKEIKNESTDLFNNIKNKYYDLKKYNTLYDIIQDIKQKDYSNPNFLSLGLSYGYFPSDIPPTKDSMEFLGKEYFKKICSNKNNNYQELYLSISKLDLDFFFGDLKILGLFGLGIVICYYLIKNTATYFYFLSKKDNYIKFFEEEIIKTGGIVLFNNILKINNNITLELNKLLDKKSWTKKEVEYYKIN